MSSKRTADDRRAALPRASDHTKAFLKDWHRLSRSGRFDMKRLKSVMLHLIENDEPLGREWLDHQLTGAWAAHRECHIGGDFLLIYRLDGTGDREIVVFVRPARMPSCLNDVAEGRPALLNCRRQPVRFSAHEVSWPCPSN